MIAGIDKMRRGEVDENREYIDKLMILQSKHNGSILLAHQGISEATNLHQRSAQDAKKTLTIMQWVKFMRDLMEF